MLAFIDESGDSGFKLKSGSSKYFTIVLVIFEDNIEASLCDQRIQLLKHELNWDLRSEFHFKNNSDKVKKAFLQAVAPYNFFYYGFVLNKANSKLYGDVFKEKKSFYKYVCGLVFENAKDKLIDATVILDETGSLEFKNQLGKYIKLKINRKNKISVKKVKMQKSSSNNLLQLADYIAGTITRSFKDKKAKNFRNLISHREIKVQIWPQ